MAMETGMKVTNKNLTIKLLSYILEYQRKKSQKIKRIKTKIIY